MQTFIKKMIIYCRVILFKKAINNLCYARSIIVSALMLTATPVCADVVTEWNMAMLDFIKSENISNQHGNRALTMVHIAMYDAVNGIKQKYSPFAQHIRLSKALDPGVTASTAAFTVVSYLYPAKRAVFEPMYNEHLSKVKNLSHRCVAQIYGRIIGMDVILLRIDDGSASAGSMSYPDGTLQGQWRRTDMRPPMLPGWGQVEPFCMLNNDQFRLIGPPDMAGYEYARDYNEVKTIGSATSTARNSQQTQTAMFWPAGIPRIWNLVAHDVSVHKNNDLIENARLFALLNLALADANVAGWDMKYHFGFWRPVTAIAYGDNDGNPDTAGEIGWNSLIPAPPFPEYISGHSISCAAAATILAKFLGTDSFNFTVHSEANPSLTPKTFGSFWAAAKDAGISRIYGGIHFNFSNAEGLEAGRSLARFIYENYMLPEK